MKIWLAVIRVFKRIIGRKKSDQPKNVIDDNYPMF